MAEKLYYSMGEVAELFDVRPSLLRYWESQFGVLRPKRNKKGNRLFTPQDVERLKLIYHLVKERGMTLDGARRALRQTRAEGGMSRDAELMERLQHIRAMLVEVREVLKSDEADEADEAEDAAADVTEAAAGPERPAAPRRRAVMRLEPAEADGASDAGERTSAAGEGKRQRRPRRRKEEAESKELFAFYEQSLF